jgi:hypothetical protein
VKKTCSCGMVLDDERFVQYAIPDMICHNCLCEFEGSFIARYYKDINYSNGEIVHRFLTDGLSCPRCKGEFHAHDFYHSITRDKGIGVLKITAMDCKLSQTEEWKCEYCGRPNSKNQETCVGCGGNREELISSIEFNGVLK